MTDRDAFAIPYDKKENIISEKECMIEFHESTPMALQAPCLVKGFGLVMCRADNEGRLYNPSEWKDGEILLFDLAAAATEIADCKERIGRYKADGFSIDIDIDNRIDKATEELKFAMRLADIQDKLERANNALGIALHCSEKLELSVAQQKLQKLASPRPFSFGTFVDSWSDSEDRGTSYFMESQSSYSSYPPRQDMNEYTEKYKSIFNSAVVSMFWKITQPAGPESFDWRKMDEEFEFIEKNNLQGIGHCLGWLNAIPDWVKRLPHTRQLIDSLLSLTDATVQRYGHLAGLWSACNEFHYHVREYKLSVEDRVAVFSAINRRLSQIHPSAAVESDSCGIRGSMRIPTGEVDPQQWYKQILKFGNSRVTIGLQIYDGMLGTTFDLGRMKRLLENYCKFGLPIHLYVSVPGGVNHPNMVDGKVTYGVWHDQWSPQIQADWWEQFLTIVLSIPQVRGVTTVSLYDTEKGWMGYEGFCLPDLRAKPVFHSVKKLLDRYTNRSAQVSWLP